MFDNVMLDLETLGTSAGCTVMSIGAVAFDVDQLKTGPEFHVIISRDSCARLGLFEDSSTVDWWDQQSVEARQTLDHATEAGLTCQEACGQFRAYLDLVSGRVEGERDVLKVWGNGSDFDQPILAKVYDVIGQKPPWEFYNSRCYRTLKGLAPYPKLTRLGTFHNAVDDARTQATHAILLLQKLNASLQG